ncbi:hypothetical protein O77CONTIG1_04500 [Leptolyngbya sp. O-77]|nr:hypothetical protein O77CONTIG1_04500 [Leptolyngbya sp. O-77]
MAIALSSRSIDPGDRPATPKSPLYLQIIGNSVMLLISAKLALCLGFGQSSGNLPASLKHWQLRHAELMS